MHDTFVDSEIHSTGFIMKTLLSVLFAALILSSCSGRKAPDIYAEGIAAESEKNPALALERFGEVVRDFPAEALAESSQYRIVTILTNADRDKRSVISAQMQFLELFPESERVPQMIFMMAFLYNNEIGNIDSARKYYELFAESWPDHELAPSAKFELETLGKGPEELLGEMPGGEDGATEAARDGDPQ